MNHYKENRFRMATLEKDYLTFKGLDPGDETGISAMSVMATEIVKEHFDPIIGSAQNDYMIRRFQTVESIKEQLTHGYRYYFIQNHEKTVGFLAFYPKDTAMYISKFYLYRSERKKGYSHQMISFIIEEARKEGCSSIELNVNRNNDACYVYERLGMTISRTEKNDIGNGFFMDDYVYSLEIQH